MAEKTTLQVLREARELITDPARWTPEWYAHDAAGNRVFGYSSKAVNWCTFGALEGATKKGLVRDSPELDDLLIILEVVAHELYPGQGGAAAVNDELGHDAVLAVYDEAIRREEVRHAEQA